VNYAEHQNRKRLVRYMVARVASADFCAHEFAARCKRGLEWREDSRRAPIPRHRALCVINAELLPDALAWREKQRTKRRAV